MEKNKLLMIIIIVLLLLFLGVSVGLSVYTISVLNSRDNGPVIEYVQDPKTLSPDQLTAYTVKDTFKTNLLKGADGADHVISVDISFAINNTDKEASDELLGILGSSEAMIKSNILAAIRGRTAEELSGEDAQEVLQGYILTKLQEAFNTNLIVEVYASSMYVY